MLDAGPIIPAEHAGFKVDQIRVNSSGTMVSCLCSSKEKSRENIMFVYSSESNSTFMYDFSTDNRIPQVMAWDVAESKLLAVQTMVSRHIYGASPGAVL